MGSRNFSGQEIVNVLQTFGYQHARTRGDHAILKYTNPDTGEKRNVTVPLHGRVRIGTLQSIATQCGAEDFQSWCRWVDEHR